MLEPSRLERPWVNQAGMRGREGRTSPDSGQREGGAYLEAVPEALRLCIRVSVGRVVEQDLWMRNHYSGIVIFQGQLPQ